MSSVLVAAAEFGFGPELVELACQPEVPLTMLVEVLTAVDPALVAPEERVVLVAGWERAAAMAAAGSTRAVAAVADGYEELGMAAMEARHEIGAALRLAPVTAADRTAVAVDLRNRYPRTLGLLDHGQISWLQAAHLARGTDDLPDETAAAVEDQVVARLPRLTASETRRAVADAVVRIDPVAARERAKRKKRERRIDRMPDRDGQIGWWLPIPVEQEGEAWAHVTRLARARKAARRAAGLDSPDEPGLDALRVDVAIDLLAGRTGEPSVGTASVPRCSCGGKQTAAVVVDLPTLLGLADDPGHVPGYGAVTAEVARAMAADRDWVRWTRDPQSGELLDVASHSYRPGDRLARYIRARHPRCVFPGCHTKPQDCDIDHCVAFGPEGPTCRGNLLPLCRQHHNAKTHGGWTYTHDQSTGSTTWTSPLGHSYLARTGPPLRT